MEQQNCAYDQMFFTFMNVFAERYRWNKIGENQFIPDVLSELIYHYAETKCIDIFATDNNKNIIDTIWIPHQYTGGRYTLHTSNTLQNINEYTVKAKLYDPHTTILFDSLMNIHTTRSFEYTNCISILTKNRIYFVINKNENNYQIWQQFKNRSQFEKFLDYNTVIDKTTAIKIATNLDLINDEITTNTRIIPCLINMRIQSILLNILFTKQFITSLHSLFGLPPISNRNELIWQIYAAKIKYQYCHMRKLQSFHYKISYKMIDHLMVKIHKRNSNCFSINNGINSNIVILKCTTKWESECVKWINHLKSLGLSLVSDEFNECDQVIKIENAEKVTLVENNFVQRKKSNEHCDCACILL
eukprot:85150_1